MDRTEQVRRAQALYKERKKQKNECRVDLHLSKRAHEALLSATHQTGLTRSSYVSRVLEGIAVETQKQNAILPSSSAEALISQHPNLESTSSDLQQEIAMLKKKLEDQSYWFDRVSAVNEALVARVRELENQSGHVILPNLDEH